MPCPLNWVHSGCRCSLNWLYRGVPGLNSAIHVKIFSRSAGGCFWGLELAFQRVPGVTKTAVGYINGDVESPTYEQVCSGRTGHTEAVDIQFDPAAVSYEDLLTVFWDQHDPTTRNRQGN